MKARGFSLSLSRRKSLRGPTGIAPPTVHPFEQVSSPGVSQYFTKGAEPRLRLGSGGKAADHREDKFVPQLRRACRSKSCLLGISSSLRPQVYKTINRDWRDASERIELDREKLQRKEESPV